MTMLNINTPLRLRDHVSTPSASVQRWRHFTRTSQMKFTRLKLCSSEKNAIEDCLRSRDFGLFVFVEWYLYFVKGI